jgi:hypothetical protein
MTFEPKTVSGHAGSRLCVKTVLTASAALDKCKPRLDSTCMVKYLNKDGGQEGNRNITVTSKTSAAKLPKLMGVPSDIGSSDPCGKSVSRTDQCSKN